MMPAPFSIPPLLLLAHFCCFRLPVGIKLVWSTRNLSWFQVKYMLTLRKFTGYTFDWKSGICESRCNESGKLLLNSKSSTSFWGRKNTKSKFAKLFYWKVTTIYDFVVVAAGPINWKLIDTHNQPGWVAIKLK